MSDDDQIYKKLVALRSQLRKQGYKETGRMPNVCSDDALLSISKLHPRTVEDFRSVPGIGDVFMDKYAAYFFKVIMDNETDTSLAAVSMDSSTRDTLEKLENKLVNINKRNILLFFGRCQNKKGLDLLLSGRDDPRELIWNERRSMVVADLYHPALSPESEKAIYTKFSALIRENDNTMRDKGQNNLYLGYPFVKGKLLGEEFNVRAPLVFIPIVADRESSKITIKQDTDRDVLYNTTILMAFCKFNKKPFDNSIGVVEEINKATFIQDTLDFFDEQGLKIIDDDPSLHRFEDYHADEFPRYESGQLYLENCAVLGNFSQFSSTIQYDFEKMLEKNEINSLVGELLETYDEMDASDMSYSGDFEVPDDDRNLQISEKDITYINDLNSSQENVIAAIKKEDKLVVKGPPGTGKSQMIASLIADFACNGKTVLMVSEKKTALDVVYSRLGILSKYAMLIDDVGSKELFYGQLQKMIDCNSITQPHTDELAELSKQIDDVVGSLQAIANAIYTPGDFGIEPYKLYRMDRWGNTSLTPRQQRALSIVEEPASESLRGMQYKDLSSSHEMFKRPDLVDSLGVHERCLEHCPALGAYPPSMSLAQLGSMVQELNKLLRDVDEFNHKGFFGKLLGKGKIKKQVSTAVDRMFTSDQSAISQKIIGGHTEGLIPSESDYVDFDRTDAVYQKLTGPEKTYLESLNRFGGIGFEVNDEVFDSTLEWHLQDFEAKNRSVIGSISSFDDKIALLRRLIERKKELSRSQMQSILSQELSKLNTGKRGKEIGRKLEAKRKWSVNKLFRTFRVELFGSVKIWMMTPEVVSEIIPLAKGMFDIVIFDEASQMFVEKGIPAILRAKKVVIVGDENQLRPNSVGIGRSNGLEDEDEDDDGEDTSIGNAALEQDSLLDLARFRYRCVILNFHYRSKYEELIAFSNHAFYKGRLYVAPNTEIPKNPPIEVIKTYDSVWTSARTSPREAHEVVMLLSRFLKERKENETVGIITFNTTQRDLIDDMIRDQCREDRQFDIAVRRELSRRDNGEDTGLFVKNIENVQGDERDVIIFSTTYAKNENGRLIRTFGSLNMDGGENRLNVAVTRAKKKVYVVTSFDPDDLRVDDLKNKGPKYFKKYLEYAHAVSNRDSVAVKQVLQSFGDQIDPGAEISFDSDFENQVYDKLRERGLEVDTQVGVGGYRIDLAIKRDGRYILGVECDGKLYHSSKSARERDLHRQNYLESRGWRIYRIWSPNWWKNSNAEVEKIVAIARLL